MLETFFKIYCISSFHCNNHGPITQLENNVFIAKSRSCAAQVESAPGNVIEKILKLFT